MGEAEEVTGHNTFFARGFSAQEFPEETSLVTSAARSGSALAQEFPEETPLVTSAARSGSG